MKKIIILALTALLFFAVGIFSACNEQDFKEEQTVGENQTLDDEKGSGKAEEVHVWGEREIVFDPNCVTNGLAICHCKECGASKAEKIPALGHVCEEWGSDQSVHYRICSRCGEKYDTSEHFFGEDLSCDECGYVCDYTLGLEYEKTDGREEYRLTGFGEFTGEVLTVPATYKGLPVTEVGENALCNVQAKKIVLPDSVLSIGYQAFRGAAAEEIVLPKFAKTLGDAAFYGCNSLKKIVLPEGLRRIGNSTFSLCLSLRSIVIPDSVTEIGYQAFDHCYTLTKITLGKNLESIENAFLQCNRLFEVYNRSVLPVAADGTMKFGGVARSAKNVYSIGAGSTKLCTSDDGIWYYEGEESVILLDYFGEQTELILPDTIDGKQCELVEHSFSKTGNVERLTVSGGIKSIPSSCFSAMSNLAELELEEGIESVGKDCFTGGKISSLNIPSSLVSVSGGSFGDSVTKIEVASDNPVFIGKGNCLIDRQSKTLVRGFVSSVIPSDGSVEIIGEDAFSGLSDLTEIQIPASVRKIETRAFFLTGLSVVALSEGVESIGVQAFALCENLSEVFLPSTVKEIYVSAFSDSPIEKITFSTAKGWMIMEKQSGEGIAADAERLADPQQAALYFKEKEGLADSRVLAKWVRTE